MSLARAVPGHLMVVGMLGLAGAAFAAIDWSTDPLSRAVTVMQTVPIFDDDGGDAMFALTAMAPGVPVSRCIRIGYDDADAAGTVGLAAESVSGALADHLRIAVERGSAGSSRNCAGFSGTSIYVGTLTGLSRGVSTGWTPVTGSAQTFRITATFTDEAAPTSATSSRADFVWRVQGGSTTATPSVGAATPPVGAGVPSVGAGVPSVGAAAPPVGAEASPTAPARGPVLAEPGHQSRTASQTFLELIIKLAKEAARHAAIPAVLIAALILFLLGQKAADRRDPKLALAPVWRNRYHWIPLHPEDGR